MAEHEPKSDRPEQGREEILRRATPLLGIGSTFVAAIVLCMAGGWWLDRRLGWSPWLTIAGAIAGIAAGFYLLVRTVTASKEGEDQGEWTE